MYKLNPIPIKILREKNHTIKTYIKQQKTKNSKKNTNNENTVVRYLPYMVLSYATELK